MKPDCFEFRRIVGAVPDSRDAGIAAHRLECRACAAFAASQYALDRRLEAALRVPVPDDLKARVIFNQSGRWMRARPRPWLAIAASLLLAAGLGFGLTQFIAGDALLAPTTRTAEPVRVSAVLDRGGVMLKQPLDNVTHAGLCPFRGRLVPHLVMHVDGEPVSVLLLKDEPVDAEKEFDEDGYRGVIVPRAGGSIAIVGARPDLLQPVQNQLEAAVRWRT